LRLRSRSPEATRAAARALARCVAAEGLTLALSGPLGSGKTAFVKGLAGGLGLAPERVASPTFVIASEYETPDGRRLAHVDLYRVGSRDELEAAGFSDLLEPGVLLAVEWADRFPDALPRDRLELRLERPPGPSRAEQRVLNAWASGPVAAAALERWRQELRGVTGVEPEESE
jgi:tRNA threonylcarbamoyladenosine biosynthesis protein TsaE